MSAQERTMRWMLPALCLGAASGGVEVAVRADPRLGMAAGGVLIWWSIAVGLNIVLALAVATVGQRWWERPTGAVLAILVAVHGGMIWRFDHAVNRFLRDPVVWGGGLIVLVLSAVLGWWVQRTRWAAVGVVRVAAAVALGSPLLAVLLSAPSEHDQRATGPNVVVMTLDTTRADHLGVYGSSNATPSLDEIARQGAVFDTVVSSSPLTEPAHLGLFTGQAPHASGVVSNGTHIGDRPGLVYRQLQDAGYATAGFVAAFPVHARFGWAQGMDVYDDDFGGLAGLHRLNLVKAWDQLALRQHVLRERPGGQVVDRALDWLGRRPPGPFFMWVHMFDAHGPYEAPGHPFDPAAQGQQMQLPAYWPPAHRAIVDADWLLEAYAAEVRYVDAQVGRLIDALGQEGVLDNTIVVVTADHGESLMENGLLFDHGDDLFEPSLRIPLLVRYPPAVKAGLRIPCLSSNLDVGPTVLGLLGRTPAEGLHGLNRTAALAGSPCRDNALVATTVVGRYMDPPPIAHALRSPGLKAVQGAAGDRECFGVGTAVADETRLEQCPETMFVALEQALASGASPVAPEQDASTTEALRALGYVE